MAWLNRIRGLLGGKHVACHVVVVGLPGSGKSTLMIQLKPPDVSMRTLTPLLPVDDTAEQFRSQAICFTAFDLGREHLDYGCAWDEYYGDCHAIIYVLDSSDHYNVSQIEEQLAKMVANPQLINRATPVLILANKMDQDGALPVLQLESMLQLAQLMAGKPYRVVATDGLTGEGLNEGLDWLAHQLRRVCRRDGAQASLLG